MYSALGDTTSLVPGFPIRTSSDPRSVDSSPRHNAASHVLHRLPVPRHPPCALKHLQHKHKKIRKNRNCTPDTKNTTPTRETAPLRVQMLATTIHKSNTTPHHQSGATTHLTWATPGPSTPVSHTRDEEIAGLLSQSPIVCLAIPRRPRSLDPVTGTVCCAPDPHPLQARPSTESPQVAVIRAMRAGLSLVVLLRKEVIQPHLPVRLPCYDFVPIADPTFDGSLPQGVRPPASGVTDFHDVTGGVYKARERIHRSVADLRLLATPTSRGRVADPDPN